MIIKWDTFSWDGRDFVIAKTDEGVCLIDIQTDDEEWKQILERHRKKLTYEKADLQALTSELVDYYEGKRQTFSFPIDPAGTLFQLDVWQAAYKVPYGQTKTYSELAKEINRPKAVRAVGAALGANPILFVVPCHRIIAQSGKLTGYRGGMPLKKHLLTLENEKITPK